MICFVWFFFIFVDAISFSFWPFFFLRFDLIFFFLFFSFEIFFCFFFLCLLIYLLIYFTSSSSS